MILLNAAGLRALVSTIFVKAGCSAVESDRIAQYLVSANLAGHDSHGVIRVPRYVQMKRDGLIHADQKLEIITDTPVIAVVDGKYGFGQTVAPQAVEIGIQKCRQVALAAVALRNSGHVGRVGDWAELAAQAGLISVHFVNAAGSVLVAPFGGVDRRFSTAPYCVGIPREGETPLILDFATSRVAEGKVLVASRGGPQVPEDALIAADGTMSSDPRLLYGDYAAEGARDYRHGAGALRAFGEHKGSGLALICELIGGSLTGTGAAEPGRRWANGMLSLYIDPRRVDPTGFFPRDVARYTAFVKSARPIVPGGEVLLPGEPEARRRSERLANGIPLSRQAWASIIATAQALGVDEPSIRLAAEGPP